MDLSQSTVSTINHEKPYRVDVVTLAKLAAKMIEDMDSGFGGLSPVAVRSIARIIESAIGAPLDTPASEDGVKAADALFPGNPSARHGFNSGVAWAIQQMPQKVRMREPEYEG